MRLAKSVAAVIVAGTVIVGLASCTPTPEAGAPTVPSSTPVNSSESPAAEAPEPELELIEDGTAEENLAYFDSVVSALTAEGNPGGRVIIDGLISAEFDKTAMQVTQDRTPLGNRVDALQFAVQLQDGCLIGQLDGQGYTGIATTALENGGCLIGQTRTIDW